jgi:Na+-translocating ferredoxin:NAD+ oxidoreductase RnfE subunit
MLIKTALLTEILEWKKIFFFKKHHILLIIYPPGVDFIKLGALHTAQQLPKVGADDKVQRSCK